MGWQDEEFGSSHDGSIGVLLADGTEPEPVYLDTGGSGASFRKTNEWWVYDGHEYGGGYGRPRAAWLRGACSCGWRGERHEVDWAAIEDWPDGVDTSGPYEDWARHVCDDVEARTIPLPEDVEDLLERMEDRLNLLESDVPLAALRAVAAVERIARKIGWKVACDIDPDQVPWDEMGKALGWSGDAVRSRLSGYAPESVRSGFWTQSGVRVS